MMEYDNGTGWGETSHDWNFDGSRYGDGRMTNETTGGDFADTFNGDLHDNGYGSHLDSDGSNGEIGPQWGDPDDY